MTTRGQGSHSLRSFKDVYLIDFVKLPLKSKKDYSDPFDIVLQTMMRDYLSKYLVLMQADWPGQFFPRQIVYQKASQATTTASNVPSSPFQLWDPCVWTLMLMRVLFRKKK